MFEFLFSYSPLTFSQGDLIAVTSFNAVWLVIGIILLVAAVVASLIYYRRHLTLGQTLVVGLLQAAAVLLIMLMLGQPVLELERLRAQDNKVVVLLDTSRSMALSDDGQNSRLQHALPAVQGDLIEPLQQRYDTEIKSFGETILPLESLDLLPAPSSRTRLAESLLATLDAANSESVGAIILISDGSDNSAIEPSWFTDLSAAGVPVHSVGLGREVMTEDVEISAVRMPQSALPEVRLAASVQVRSGTEQNVQLKVYDENQLLAVQDILLPGGGHLSQHRITLPTGEVGLRQLRFVIDPSPQDRIPANNQFLHALTVAAREPRVLYVEGEPRWEYKFIRRAVEDENFLHLHTLLRTSPNRIYRQGIELPEQLADGFPATREELFTYDALILGSQEAASFSTDQIDLIKNFVSERGGALLFLGGRQSLTDGDWQNTAITDLLPVVLPEGSKTFARRLVRVQPTELGLRSNWLRFAEDDNENQEKWLALPELADFQVIGKPKPGASTLLETRLPEQTAPILVTQRYGRGKVVILATSGTWRWQMQMPADDLSHEIFWQQLLQEVVRDTPHQIEISATQNWYRDNPRIELEARVRSSSFLPDSDAQIDLTLIPELGTPMNMDFIQVSGQPGLYRAIAEVAENGPVQLDTLIRNGSEEIASQRLFVNRSDNLAEFYNPAQNRALLERIAAQTGGDYWTLDNLANLPEQIQFSGAGVTEREWLPLWSMPINFILLLVLKSSEWLLRRRWGHL